jgi:hypothetical protein
MAHVTRSRFVALVATAICAAALLVPAASLAQDALSDPSAAQYEPQSQVAGATETGSAPSTAGPAAGSASGVNANIGSLPFTGLDLIMVAGVALVLVGTGFLLRRLAAPRAPGS